MRGSLNSFSGGRVSITVPEPDDSDSEEGEDDVENDPKQRWSRPLQPAFMPGRFVLSVSVLVLIRRSSGHHCLVDWVEGVTDDWYRHGVRM